MKSESRPQANGDGSLLSSGDEGAGLTENLQESQAPELGARRFRDAWERGFSVIPLLTRDKKPAGAWKQYQTERCTAEQARAWDESNLNVGIVTGAISGDLLVLDCDSEEAFRLAVERGFVANAPTVRTGKGFHVYYRVPAGFSIPRNSASKLGPGIDIRGEGGFVVAPGSIHPNGSIYEWASPNA